MESWNNVSRQDVLLLLHSSALYTLPCRVSESFSLTHAQTILSSVNMFYTDILSNAFDNFETFTATEDSTTSNVAGTFTLSMVSYSATSTFTDGTDIPTQDEVDNAIQAADLNNFIQNYIPNATPDDNIYAGTIMATSLSTTGG